jgi:hypothetical protein
MSRLFRALSLALLVLATFPSESRAEWLVMPYAGITLGTKATFSDFALQFDNEFDPAPLFGAALVWQKSRVFEIEGDFGLSPDFFGRRVGEDDFQYGDNQLISLMGNLRMNLPWPSGGTGHIRPYGAAGIGVFLTRISDPEGAFTADGNQLAFDAGGGITAPMGARFLLQADVRYFRTLQAATPKDEVDLAIDSLSFWRTTVGFGIRF